MIVSYFDCDNKEELVQKIAACDWSAARFLVQLLKEGTFYETLGGWGELYLLMDGENLVSFATFTGQDAVRDESLVPWIGFVFTVPEYRSHRYAGRVLAHAEAAAAARGYDKIYTISVLTMWGFTKNTATNIRKTAWIAGAVTSGYCSKSWTAQPEHSKTSVQYNRGV